MAIDMIVTNGRIVTSTEILSPKIEIGITNGIISCLGVNLPRSPTTTILDAEGAYITPGGIDSHVHIQQENSPTGDTWASATRSAIAGGTTTVLAFASQKKTDPSLLPVVSKYQSLASGQSHCDYGIHVILTNPSAQVINVELPHLMAVEGISSVKLYTTYDPMKLNDTEVLDVMMAARAHGFTTMIHAENDSMIALINKRLATKNLTEPYYHSVSRPQIAESEATHRVIALAELTAVPILIVHMSARGAVSHVREAQGRNLPIHAETCPQYLFLLSQRIRGSEEDPFIGAQCVCSPPLRHEPADLEAMWTGLANGTFTVYSSDHAPSTYDHPRGKKLGLLDHDHNDNDGDAKKMDYKKIPNGLPGIETRVPLLFDHSGEDKNHKLTLPRFVALTSTAAAKLYGLDGRKGSIAPGYDADIVIWYPEGDERGQTTISQSILHHGVDYTPFEGHRVRNWPRKTLLRGKVVWDREMGGVVGGVEDGVFLKRGRGMVVTGSLAGLKRDADGMGVGERRMWAD